MSLSILQILTALFCFSGKPIECPSLGWSSVTYFPQGPSGGARYKNLNTSTDQYFTFSPCLATFLLCFSYCIGLALTPLLPCRWNPPIGQSAQGWRHVGRIWTRGPGVGATWAFKCYNIKLLCSIFILQGNVFGLMQELSLFCQSFKLWPNVTSLLYKEAYFICNHSTPCSS